MRDLREKFPVLFLHSLSLSGEHYHTTQYTWERNWDSCPVNLM